MNALYRLLRPLRSSAPRRRLPLWLLVPRPAPGSVARAWAEQRYNRALGL